MNDLNYEDTKDVLEQYEGSTLVHKTVTSKKGKVSVKYLCEDRKYGFKWVVGKRTLTALEKEGYAVIYE
jgi:hypothetical protein